MGLNLFTNSKLPQGFHNLEVVLFNATLPSFSPNAPFKTRKLRTGWGFFGEKTFNALPKFVKHFNTTQGFSHLALCCQRFIGEVHLVAKSKRVVLLCFSAFSFGGSPIRVFLRPPPTKNKTPQGRL
eukprot:EG_transcript_37616